MKEVVVIIPSFCPPNGLDGLCKELQEQGFQKILVVNDGSPRAFDKIFESLQSLRINVLQTSTNNGKGHAIKTGLTYALKNYPDITHFLFCDDDGQHAVKDVTKIAQKAIDENKAFVLGQRNFTGHTPWKSLLGNTITSCVLKLRFGINAPDSQTGLRCMGREIATKLLSISEDRFGFELKALIMIHNSAIEICSVPIETIYFDGNSRTRFRPVRDSLVVIQIALGLKR